MRAGQMSSALQRYSPACIWFVLQLLSLYSTLGPPGIKEQRIVTDHLGHDRPIGRARHPASSTAPSAQASARTETAELVAASRTMAVLLLVRVGVSRGLGGLGMHGDPSTVWGVLVIQAAHRGMAPWDLELFTAGRPGPQLHCLPRGGSGCGCGAGCSTLAKSWPTTASCVLLPSMRANAVDFQEAGAARGHHALRACTGTTHTPICVVQEDGCCVE